MKKGLTYIETAVIVTIVVIISIVVIALIHDTENTIPITSASVQYPEPTGYVVDGSSVLSASTIAVLSIRLQQIDQKAQVAVLTIPSTQPLSIDEYGIKLAEKWKVGHKGIDNGVILIVATQDRKIRIEVGRGVEDKLNDSEAAIIVRDTIAPYLKKGDWDDGVTAGVEAIIKAINK